MYNFLLKHGQTLSFGIGAAIALIFVLIAFGGVSGLGDSPTNEELYPTSYFDFGLYGAYFLTAVAALAALVFPLVQSAQNPKQAIRGLISFGIIALIFIVAYSMASSDMTPAMKTFGLSTGIGKFIGGAITTSIILAVGAVILMIGAEARSFFK